MNEDRIDGDFWILRKGKEKERGCDQVQTLSLMIDLDNWDADDLMQEIKKMMLRLEKQKAGVFC